MPQTITDAIERIGDRLEKVIIPKAWRPTRDVIRELSASISDLVVEGMAAKSVKQIAEDSEQTPKDKRMAARRVVKSRIFGDVIPGTLADAMERIIELKRAAARTVYQFTTESLGNVLNANSPDGITFKPRISKAELSAAEGLLADGLLYQQSVIELFHPLPDRIRGAVLDASIKHGRSSMATRDAVIGVRGMFNQLEKDLARLFEVHMLAVDQQAEIDSRIPVR